MKMVTISSVVAVLAFFAAPPLRDFFFARGTTDEQVISYAVILPLFLAAAAIAGVLVAALGDFLAGSIAVDSFRWRPGRAYLTGRDNDNKE